MALNFPSNPTPNQEYTSGSLTYKWNGTSWIGVVAGSSNIFDQDLNTTDNVIFNSVTFPNDTTQSTAFTGTGDVGFYQNRIVNGNSIDDALLIMGGGTGGYAGETYMYFPGNAEAVSGTPITIRNFVSDVVIGTSSAASWRFNISDQSLSIPNGWGVDDTGTASLLAPNGLAILRGSSGGRLQFVRTTPDVTDGVTNWVGANVSEFGATVEITGGDGNSTTGKTVSWTFDPNGNTLYPGNVTQSSQAATTCLENVDTVIYTSTAQYQHAIKLFVLVEGAGVGNISDAQACEIIAVRGYNDNIIHVTTYGVTYTSLGAIAEFDGRWNSTSNRIEITCRPVTLASVTVSVHATELQSNN